VSYYSIIIIIIKVNGTEVLHTDKRM